MATEKTVCYSQLLRGGSHHTMRGHTGNRQGQSGSTGRREKQGKNIYCSFLGKTGKAGQAGLGLASLNNIIGLWGIGAAPSCLVPSPGVVRAGEFPKRTWAYLKRC